jgi:hypothetical protein
MLKYATRWLSELGFAHIGYDMWTTVLFTVQSQCSRALGYDMCPTEISTAW